MSDDAAVTEVESPAKKGSGAVVWLVILVMLIAACAAGYYFLQEMRKPAQDPESLALEKDVEDFLRTSQRLQQSFNSKKSLDALPSKLPQRVRGKESAAWALYTGQFAGRLNVSDPDTALTAYPLSRKACLRINALLWQEAKIPASGMPHSAIENGTADMLALFDGKDRLESCVSLAGGGYLYFAVVGRPIEIAPTAKPDSAKK
jgi:hypothetical protein